MQSDKHSKTLVRLAALCLGVVFTLVVGQFTPAIGLAQQTEILWDTYGVPHIYSQSVPQLFYAFGWAQMHSHANLILQLYGQARGRAAEYWGEDNLDSDRWVQTVGIPERAQVWYEAQTPEFRHYLDAFADGVNAYAQAHPDLIEDDVEVVLPVNGIDLLAHVQRVLHFTFMLNPEQVANLAESAQTARARQLGTVGSNGWAIAPSRTQQGHAMLLVNPHLPWSDLFRWYEAQLTAPGVDAYGAALVGIPVLNIAFNERLGWTHTVNTHDGWDAYALNLVDTGYELDGEIRSFDLDNRILKVKQAGGSWREEVLQIRRSVHGPVVMEQNNQAIALRVVGLDQPGVLQEWWDMARASNLTEFEAALQRLQIPMFTVIYADRDGHILHLFNGQVPVRSGGHFDDWLDLIPGNTSANLWTKTHPYSDLPRLLDPASGWLQNANDPPWTTTLPQVLHPDDYPSYIAPPGPMWFRAQEAARMLMDDDQISLAELVQYKHSTHVLAFAVTLGEAGTTAEEDAIQVVVTGEQDDDYYVPNTSVGTRTDTPLRDIPQSIQVVPQQVLQDRQARRITDGLENVSGVNSIQTAAGSRENFTIRGFENYSNALLNGIPDPQITSDSSFINVERLEVLKGPASVLYGETGFSAIGGTINFVTRQPLSDPFYEISTTIGSFNDYQGVIDLSGPLNDSETVLYRLIAGYQSAETFIDFNDFTELSVAPSLSLRLGNNTDLVVEGDVNIIERNGQQPDGLPAVGSVLPNPNGEVDNSFSLVGPVEDNQTVVGRVGYRLEHRFNENLRLRNAFRYTFYDDNGPDDTNIIFGTSLADDNRTLNRGISIGRQFYDYYYLDTNLLGEFSTGSIEHQLLFGFSLSRNVFDTRYEFGAFIPPVDIFNPVYDNTVVRTGVLDLDQLRTRDTLGIYLQDQITLAENLKLLLGGRVDFFEERTTNRLVGEETSQSDTAFSPRVGVVYQPIQPISLYASYSQSFAPTIGISATGEAFQPERGTQYEVGIKADINDQLSATLAFYDLTRTNVTTTDPDNSNFSVQTGEQNSQGIELDISGEILPGWNIIAGYAYTDAKVTEDNNIPEGNRLFAAPEHAFHLWTTYRIRQGDLQGLGFGLGFYYVGEAAGNLANTFEVPSSFRTDAAIFYERDRFRAAVNFRNLFDVEIYRAIGSSTLVGVGDPFTVQGTISWQF
jgi:iron complex outermembrane receptor protein